MIATIYPHTPTQERPTQQWAAFDEDGLALGYAHHKEKLVRWLQEKGYTVEYNDSPYNFIL